jgi:hypothetical protein
MEAKKPSTMALNTDGDRPVEVQRQTTYFDAKAGVSALLARCRQQFEETGADLALSLCPAARA